MRKIKLHSRFCAYHFNFGVSRLLSIQLNFIDRDTACWWKQYFLQNVYLMFFKHVYFTWLNRFYCPTLFWVYEILSTTLTERFSLISLFEMYTSFLNKKFRCCLRQVKPKCLKDLGDFSCSFIYTKRKQKFLLFILK